MLSWFRREALVLAGTIGAALTLLAQLSNVVPMTTGLLGVLAWWRTAMQALWQPLFDLLGLTLHPHLVAALSAAAFMTMTGIGIRLSARLSGKPLSPPRLLEHTTWWSLALFLAICIVFLIGQDAEPSKGQPVTFYGSKELGKLILACVWASGYFAGEFFGHAEFHRQLGYLVLVTVATLGFDMAVLCVWR